MSSLTWWWLVIMGSLQASQTYVVQSPAQGYAPIILSIKPETPDSAQVCAQKVGALASCRSVREVRDFLDKREPK
jgi:hypothetical protein